MSRAHVKGFDTNAAQFERMGNPWITRREQQELGNSPVSRGKQRQNRKARPCDLPYKEIQRIGRALTPEEARAKRHREMLYHIRRLDKSIKGEPVRETTGYQPRQPLVATVKPAAQQPVLDPMSHEHFEAESQRLARKHASAVREVQVCKLTQLQKALAAYDKKMAKAFA